jgi:glycosyltransferase involved in cell wall biosynthesis
LTFTTLFPSASRPRHGIFVETRLRHLIATDELIACVLAPVPWFPSTHPGFGRYARIAATPRIEERNGIRVHHPRYFTLPKCGMRLQPRSLAWAALREVARIRREGWDFDLVDAHYLYPDGVAAAAVAARLGKPLVMTARGSDVNLLARFPAARRAILDAVARASAVVTVSSALRERLVAMGCDPLRLHVLRNGVDLELFRPHPKASVRAELGLADGYVALSVGNLVPEKGHDLAIEAISSIDNLTLLIVGDGAEESALARLVAERGLASRVRFLPARSQSELARIYSAADLLVLASSREGWPNVILEAMACGTPVVATNVGGVPEIVTDPRAGSIAPSRTGPAIAAEIRRLLSEPRDPDAVRRHAGRFGWSETTAGQLALFRSVLGMPVAAPLPGGPRPRVQAGCGGARRTQTP